MSPGAIDRRRQPAEPDLPLVAPDLQVHVDDVVVRGRDAAQPVADAEAAPLRRRSVVPDDPHAVLGLRRPVRARARRAAELRARSRPVGDVALGDRDLVERLPVLERDLAERAAEVTGEVERDRLVDRQAAVRRDLDDDVGRGKREGLRCGVPGERERRRGAPPLERDAWCLPRRLFLELEELLLREAERAGEDDARHRLDRVVVGEDGVVVDLARDGDPVLRLAELGLELAEVLVRLQLRVCLGDREEAAERLAEDALPPRPARPVPAPPARATALR